MPIIDLGRVVGRDGEDGAPGSGGSSLPNLLDNSNFKKPINQRGVSGTISAAGYFIDRWKLMSGSVTIETGGLMLNGEIAQILESAPVGDVTAAASAGNASFDAETNTFSLIASGEMIEWAALYEGFYTAETLPPYVNKGYISEILECQRYFFPLNRNSICFGSTNASKSAFYGDVFTPAPMHDAPSVETGANKYLLTNNGSQVSISNALTVSSITGNKVQLMIRIDGSGMGASIVSKIWADTGNNFVYLNAEL